MKKSLLLAWALFAAASHAQNAQPLRLTGAVLTRSCGNNHWDLKAEPETDFLITDRGLCLTWGVSGGGAGDQLRIEWHDPSGALYGREWKYDAPRNSSTGGLSISGSDVARKPGNWEVKFFANQQWLQTLQFRIITPESTVVKLVSNTVLPQATEKVRYRYEFSAQGGVPPYRWAALNDAPPGLTLSSDGTLSGTPARWGNFRLVLRADDSKGNGVQRTVGLSIGPSGERWVRVVRQVVSKEPAGPDACAAPAVTTRFSPNDLNAWVTFAVEPVNRPDRRAFVQWLNPRGDVHSEFPFQPRSSLEKQCFRSNIPIANAGPATMPGTWRVRLIWQGGEVFSLPFEVSSCLPGRHALVIGNSAYKKLPAIPSVPAETEAVANALREDGFDVDVKRDLSLEDWVQAESEFAKKLEPGDRAVVYFTGYGLQKNGGDWLVTTNYDPRENAPLSSTAYSTARLSQSLEDSHLKLAVIVLDAAREQSGLKAAGQSPGLARMDAGPGIIVVSSLPPGRTEPVSQEAKPGPFAEAFVETLQMAGVGLGQLLTVELPKALGKVAPERPAPVSLMQTKEEFLFRPASVENRDDAAAATRLYGTWQFGRAASTDPALPVGRLCNFTLSANRGKFGNAISGTCSGNESFWRVSGDQLHLIGVGGVVWTVLSRVSDDLWQGEFLLSPGTVHDLKRLPPGTGAISSGLSTNAFPLCLDLDFPSKALQIWRCHGLNNQLFTKTERGELTIYDRCVDHDAGGTASRELGTAACNGGASQKWEFQPNGHIVGNHGECLAVKDGKAGNGTRLVTVGCEDGNPAQTWRGWTRAETADCSREAELKSQGSTDAASLEFYNATTSSIRKLYWLDFSGKRQLYNTLPPGRSYGIGSFTGHSWAVTDVADQCVAIYTVTSRRESFVIQK